MSCMKPKEEFINHMKHYRHDWLNHIQIIKGYLSLGKVDVAQKFLDHVIINSHYESKISQLGNVDLAYHLLTYNWTQDRVVLEVEIEDDGVEISSVGKNYPYIGSWIMEITKIVEENSEINQENRLSILLDITVERLTVTVEFVGNWAEQEGRKAIMRLQELVEKDQGKLVLGEHSKSEFTFEIFT
jgi:stage 0 sporulation protein B (sporulation initiation phosphotransferase)